MGYIRVQPDNSPASLAVIKYLAAIGECLIYLFLDDPRLRPFLFGSRDNMSYERKYHSFVKEAACERSSIAACHIYVSDVMFIGYVAITLSKKLSRTIVVFTN